MLIGRERELAELTALLKRGHPVAMLGEAGVGKTALVRHAIAVAGRPAFEGGALGTLSWMPYLPIRRALGKRWAPSGDDLYVARDVRGRVGDALLFIDDLHWADPQTRRLVPLLAGKTAVVTALRRGDAATEAVVAGLTAAGFTTIDIEPLEHRDAMTLVARLRPDIVPGEGARIVGLAGGNPLLIEELSTQGGPTDSLRMALGARLRGLSPAARRAMALLSLARQPLPGEALGGGVPELLASGLVVEGPDGCTVRHALLAETLVAEIGESERRELHAILARALDAPGQAARHHAAAGERELAYAAAVEAAASTPDAGERGRHLALAASSIDGAAADALRLDAARALVLAHDDAGIEDLLDGIASDDALVQAEAWFLRYSAREVGLDDTGARAAWRRAMDLAAGSGSELEVRLRVEAGRIAYLLDLDPRAVEIAEAGLRLARERGCHVVLAEFVLGSALWAAWDPRWRPALERVVQAARQAGEAGAEHRATNNLVLGLLLEGDVVRARDVALESESMAQQRHLGRWGERMTVLLVKVDWQDGRLKSAVGRAEAVLAEAEGVHRRDAMIYLSHALLDLGRLGATRRLLKTLLLESAPDSRTADGTVADHVDALTALAEAELWGGRPAAALDALQTARRYDVNELATDAVCAIPLLEAWAAHELGRPAPRAPQPSVFRLWEAAPSEAAAIRRLGEGDANAASGQFAEAAELWRGRHFGAFLRCWWAHGEALRRAGRRAEALEALGDAEALARERGYALIQARVERSLRLAGVHRAAGRGHHGALTARERELLTLVAEGRSNAEISRQLGLSSSSVRRTIEGATAKLGATSRLHAAALAARQIP